MNTVSYEKTLATYLRDNLPRTAPSKNDLVLALDDEAHELQAPLKEQTLLWIITALDRLLEDGYVKLVTLKKGREKGSVRLTFISMPEDTWFKGDGGSSHTPAAVFGVIEAAQLEGEIEDTC